MVVFCQAVRHHGESPWAGFASQIGWNQHPIKNGVGPCRISSNPNKGGSAPPFLHCPPCRGPVEVCIFFNILKYRTALTD